MWLHACAVALLCAALADAESLKRAEMSPSTFVLTSRYGRSPQRSMSTRSDRFFLVGRYGKRSDASLEQRNRLKTLGHMRSSDRYKEWQKNRDRDRERDYALHRWRSRCYCVPHKAFPFRSYYKRNAGILNKMSEAD